MDELKQISIKDYLELRGFQMEQHGPKWFCSSPFSRDTNWSFCIYPSNTYYCWSTGRHGDIINLVSQLENLDFKQSLEHLTAGNYSRYTLNYSKFKPDENVYTEFDYTKYLTNNEEEKKAIISYGLSRSIYSGYHCGVYFTRNRDSKNPNKWIRHPAMMFLHQDVNGNICGAKFRKIYDNNIVDGGNGSRFSARGQLGFYILDTEISEHYNKNRLWLCESETSSNSLWEYLRKRGIPSVVISMGGVSSGYKKLPNKFTDYQINLIIDYDGSEELYQQRLKQYNHLNVKPIKLILPKGEDINSLYNKGEIWKIETLLAL